MTDRERAVTRDLALYLLPVLAIPFALVGAFFFFAVQLAPEKEVLYELLSERETALVALAEEVIALRSSSERSATSGSEIRVSRIGGSGRGPAAGELRVSFGVSSGSPGLEWAAAGFRHDLHDSYLEAMTASSVRSLLSTPRGEIELVEFTFNDEIQKRARRHLLYVRGGALGEGEHLRNHRNGQWRVR